MAIKPDSYRYNYCEFSHIQKEDAKTLVSLLLKAEEEINSLTESGKNVKLFFNVEHNYLHYIQLHKRLKEEPPHFYDYSKGVEPLDKFEFIDKTSILIINGTHIPTLKNELEDYKSPILREN